MLQINLSKAEIQRLNYERCYYPCPLVQKRMHAVYIPTFIKKVIRMTNIIAKIFLVVVHAYAKVDNYLLLN